ncbi:MAG: HlyD family efflux transporter periplasmic adaptor subunit [Pseudomonadota bacterium]
MNTAHPSSEMSASTDDVFAQAKTADEFCQRWLAQLAKRLLVLGVDVDVAAILVSGSAENTFVPFAAWPDRALRLEHLSEAVQGALRQRSCLVLPAAEGGDGPGEAAFVIAYPLLADAQVLAVVALSVRSVRCVADKVADVLQELNWGSAWLSQLFTRQAHELTRQARDRLATVMETLAVALQQGKFRQALFALANELRQVFACAQVAIGLAEEAKVSVVALSEAASFESHTPLLKAYAAAMEEAHDAALPLSGTLQTGARVPDLAPAREGPCQRDLLAQSGAGAVLSYPLLQGAQCVGVLVLERAGEQHFSPADLLWLDAFAALLTPVFAQRLAAERSSLVRLKGELRYLRERFFGSGHLLWKAAASGLALVLALLYWLPVDYRVSAKTVIEGETQRIAAAPFDGFIAAEYARAGDSVRQGQLLARLDERDLLIEQQRWASERDQHEHKLREAMAMHDLTAVQVVDAELRQAEAQFALASEKIERAKIVAPYSGTVVSGDLSQQIGAPVEQGKKLFEVAPLQRYRVILQVDERDIRHLRVGQKGLLVITGLAADRLAFSVAKLTPVAVAQDGKNFFRVEALLAAASPRLRPGMEGVGKIEVGERSLGWVLTHSFSEWLTLSVWTWLP